MNVGGAFLRCGFRGKPNSHSDLDDDDDDLLVVAAVQYMVNGAAELAAWSARYPDTPAAVMPQSGWTRENG